MSILIRGMEMPSCCMFCPISAAASCGLSNPPVIMTSKEMLQGRPDWCPLVPIPPHGRLIDADDTENITVIMNENGSGFNRIIAPIIIEAEEGE